MYKNKVIACTLNVILDVNTTNQCFKVCWSRASSTKLLKYQTLSCWCIFNNMSFSVWHLETNYLNGVSPVFVPALSSLFDSQSQTSLYSPQQPLSSSGSETSLRPPSQPLWRECLQDFMAEWQLLSFVVDSLCCDAIDTEGFLGVLSRCL